MSDAYYTFEPETIFEQVWFHLRHILKELSNIGLGRFSLGGEDDVGEQVVGREAVFSTEIELPGRRTSEHLRAIKLRLEELLPVSPARLTVSVKRLARTTEVSRRYRVIAIDDGSIDPGSEVLVLPVESGLAVASKTGARRMERGLRRTGFGMLVGFVVSALLSSTLSAHYEQELVGSLAEQRQVNLALTRTRRASQLAAQISVATSGSVRVSDSLAVSSWLVERLPGGVTLRTMSVADRGFVIELEGDRLANADIFGEPPEAFSLEFDPIVQVLRLTPYLSESADE